MPRTWLGGCELLQRAANLLDRLRIAFGQLQRFAILRSGTIHIAQRCQSLGQIDPRREHLAVNAQHPPILVRGFLQLPTRRQR